MSWDRTVNHVPGPDRAIRLCIAAIGSWGSSRAPAEPAPGLRAPEAPVLGRSSAFTTNVVMRVRRIRRIAPLALVDVPEPVGASPPPVGQRGLPVALRAIPGGAS